MASYIITVSPVGATPNMADIAGTLQAKSPAQALAMVASRYGNTEGMIVTVHPYNKAPESWKVRADMIGSM